MLSDPLDQIDPLPLPSAVKTNFLDNSYIENLPIITPVIDDIDEQFRWVVEYMKHHDPKELVGKKLSRKKSYHIAGDTVKLKDRFIFMFVRDKKVIPYMISDDLLGEGSQGKIKVNKKCVFDEAGAYSSFQVFVMKIIKPHQNPRSLYFLKTQIPIELECLSKMQQLDAVVQCTDAARKIYISMTFILGRQIVVYDKLKANELTNALIKSGVIKDDLTDYVRLVDYIKIRVSSDIFHVNLCCELDTATIATELARLFACMHYYGFAHLDIKGENIMYDPETKIVKVVDFGLALPIGSDLVFRGTPYYMSPEVAALSITSYFNVIPKVTGKEDVYSLGLVFQKILKLDKHSKYARSFSDLIDKMLSNNPEDRPIMVQVYHALKEIAAQPTTIVIEPILTAFKSSTQRQARDSTQSPHSSESLGSPTVVAAVPCF